MSNMKGIIGLEDGKTYHVVVGDKDNIPTSEDIDRIHEQFKRANPKITWIVTSYLIKIKGAKEIKMAKPKNKKPKRAY